MRTTFSVLFLTFCISGCASSVDFRAKSFEGVAARCIAQNHVCTPGVSVFVSGQKVVSDDGVYLLLKYTCPDEEYFLFQSSRQSGNAYVVHRSLNTALDKFKSLHADGNKVVHLYTQSGDEWVFTSGELWHLSDRRKAVNDIQSFIE